MIKTIKNFIILFYLIIYFENFFNYWNFFSLFRMPFSKPMVLVDVLGGQYSVFIAHQALASLFINQRPRLFIIIIMLTITYFLLSSNCSVIETKITLYLLQLKITLLSQEKTTAVRLIIIKYLIKFHLPVCEILDA